MHYTNSELMKSVQFKQHFSDGKKSQSPLITVMISTVKYTYHASAAG